MKERRLPLGIDLGTSRVRVVALSQQCDGKLRLLAVAAAAVETHGDHALALRAALKDLGMRHRDCAMLVAAATSRIGIVRFPPMSRSERERSTVFEGQALLPKEKGPIVVRAAPLADGRTILAAAPREAIVRLHSVARAAGLRITGIDQESLALWRLARAPLLDVGFAGSTLVVEIGGVPAVRRIGLGGDDFTVALANEYGTSRTIAEERKRTLGLGGACSASLKAYVEALDAELLDLRTRDGVDVRSLLVCGNGCRLRGLCDAIERAIGVALRPIEAAALVRTDLPLELDREGAADWFGAIAATGAWPGRLGVAAA